MAAINPADFPGIMEQHQVQPASVFVLSMTGVIPECAIPDDGEDSGIFLMAHTQICPPLQSTVSLQHDVMSTISSEVKKNKTNSF